VPLSEMVWDEALVEVWDEALDVAWVDALEIASDEALVRSLVQESCQETMSPVPPWVQGSLVQ